MLAILVDVKKDKAFPMLALALKQRCVRVDLDKVGVDVCGCETRVQEFIPVDGSPEEAQVQEVLDRMRPLYRELDVSTLVRLAALVDPSKSAGDIPLPMDFACGGGSPSAGGGGSSSAGGGSGSLSAGGGRVDTWAMSSGCVEWVYGMAVVVALADVPLCPATYRPYYRVSGGGPISEGELWHERAVRIHQAPVRKQISMFHWYCCFVAKYTRFPTVQDLLVFIYNRVVVHGSGGEKHSTLPFMVERYAEEIVRKYQALLLSQADPHPPTPEVFCRTVEASRVIEERVRLEQRESEAPYSTALTPGDEIVGREHINREADAAVGGDDEEKS